MIDPNSLPLDVAGASFDTIGSVLIALHIGQILFGLVVYQVHYYFKTFPDDGIWIKSFVSMVMLTQTVHSMLWTLASYHYGITDPYSTAALSPAHWSLRVVFMMTALAVAAPQIFYALRILHMWDCRRKGLVVGDRRSNWLLGLVVFALLCILAYLGIASTAGGTSFSEVTSLASFRKLGWLVATAYGLAAVTDLIMAATLVVMLHRCRVAVRGSKTDTVLSILIKYTINTGLLTSIGSVLAFVFVLILPGNFIYCGFSVIGTKLYGNSVLAMLNSRHYMNSRLLDDFTPSDVIDHSTRSQREPRMTWNISAGGRSIATRGGDRDPLPSPPGSDAGLLQRPAPAPAAAVMSRTW
ncbi:hypothetical protein GY45DRAFT_105668 [Cubamyces sp. BRFM 1775]|nr:hypothetical protein GY45DRAFT_105668 [Cubamyces sp. BRFM 1775]